MKTLLKETPHLLLKTHCPTCNRSIDYYDYRVEDWDEYQELKKKRIAYRLFKTNNAPIICPGCGEYFGHNKITGQNQIKDKVPSILNKYKELLMKRNNINFESFHYGCIANQEDFLLESSKEMMVSFDFDGTIANTRKDKDNKYVVDEQDNLIIDGIRKDIEEKIWEYYNQGYKIIIVTARPDESKQQVLDFVEQYKLPIYKVYCTNYKPKWVLLRRMPIKAHYDDTQKEIDGLEKVHKKGILV